MNTMKALPASALALIVILMLSLFTSCSEQPQPEADASPNIVKATSLADMPAETLATEEAETLNVSAEGMYVMNAATCTGIEAHLPSGEGSEFSIGVGRVYLHTQIGMPEGSNGQIKHIWKRNGKTVSTVELSVKGPSFRTWSYKTITDRMDGSWTVDVETASGELLETVAFEIE